MPIFSFLPMFILSLEKKSRPIRGKITFNFQELYKFLNLYK